MAIQEIPTFFIKLYYTSKSVILFRLNGILNSLSLYSESETIDNLRIKYGNWYNSQLMRKFIECDYYLNSKHFVLKLKHMETLGNIVILKVHFLGMTKSQMSEYLTNSIGNAIPSTRVNIQVSSIDDHNAKVVFPL